MRFEHLPAEILAQVLSGNFSWAIFELWKCGNRELNTKLSRYAIRDIIIRDTSKRGIGRWPSCLKEFTLLRSLSIERFAGLCTIYTLRQELSKLPPTLKTLKIAAMGVIEALFTSEDFLVDTDYPTTLSDADYFWNDTWKPLPQLESLEVSAMLMTGGTLETDFFQRLPRSLTRFRLDHCKLCDATPEDYAKLPSTLTSLHLPSQSVSTPALRHIPKILTTLNPCLTESALLELMREPEILPNLTSFPLAPRMSLSIDATMSLTSQPELIWPTSMQSLTISSVDSTFFRILPKNLTSLTFIDTCGAPDITSERLINCFPITLTEIDGARINWSEITTSQWPPFLTFLGLSNSPFDLSHFHKLPRSLQRFRPPSKPLAMRTNDTSSLLVFGQDLLSTYDHYAWANAKAKLLQMSDKATSARVREYIEAVERGELYGLPLGLTDISIQYSSLSALNLQYLWPPAVKNVDLQDTAKTTTKSYFRLLPPSVTSLTLQTPSSICHLPRKLQKLILQVTTTKITAAQLESLPPTLIDLELRLSGISGQRPWTQLLPTTLTRLTLHGASVNGSELATLPASLTYLSCSVVDATLAQVRKMPHNLRKVSISSSEKNPPMEKLNSAKWRRLAQAYEPFYKIFRADKNELQYVALTDLDGESSSRYFGRQEEDRCEGIKDVHFFTSLKLNMEWKKISKKIW